MQAKGFIYSTHVETNSKKKLIQNCSVDMDDLFQRIFTVNEEERITFVEIR